MVPPTTRPKARSQAGAQRTRTHALSWAEKPIKESTKTKITKAKKFNKSKAKKHLAKSKKTLKASASAAGA